MNQLQRPDFRLPRRKFIRGVALGAGALASSGGLLAANASTGNDPDPARPAYRGPNVILIRFGGGVRRRETIDPVNTYAPFFCHDLIQRGTLHKNMEISSLAGVETSHGQGTLYIITGKYDKYKDVAGKFLGARFEAQVPTVFEYLRKQYDVPAHQTLIVNGEDRTDEEFYTFSNHHLFGVQFRSNVLSLYRFKTFLLRQQIAEGKFKDSELAEKKNELAKMEKLDYRAKGYDAQGPEIEKFWERWRRMYGETGLRNPRGDRLLTELSIRALKELRPKLLMVNYNDPDYVHWGNMTHYTRGIAVIDEGMRQLVATVEADPEYRDNTIFIIVPDCGRDTNPAMAVPCQHHFGSRSSHEIFSLMFGLGIARGVVVDKLSNQINLAGTVGKIMGFKANEAEGHMLEEVFA
jgi:hypothetical protein